MGACAECCGERKIMMKHLKDGQDQNSSFNFDMSDNKKGKKAPKHVRF